MDEREAIRGQAGLSHAPAGARQPAAAHAASWSFIYIFFTNGTPYDAPNRSETCPPR